jgi:aminopeptidase N
MLMYRGTMILLFFLRRYMVGTQFEAAAARKAFPCMDEPTFKQTFTATLWKKPPMIALSNMPESYTEIL